MTPKEALIKDGKVPVKAGRGRLSREAKARLEELVAEGWKIDDYSVKTSPATAKDTKPVVVQKPKATGKVIEEYVIFWDEHEYKALDSNNKERSMREACNNCHVSLVQNHCDNPTIVRQDGAGNVAVRIVRR